MKDVAIIVMALAIAFLSDRLVREENQRYALFLGMCVHPPGTPLAAFPDYDCLQSVQTRTSWGWHLFYAVTDKLPAVSLFD